MKRELGLGFSTFAEERIPAIFPTVDDVVGLSQIARNTTCSFIKRVIEGHGIVNSSPVSLIVGTSLTEPIWTINETVLVPGKGEHLLLQH